MTLTLDIAADLEHQILHEARRRGLDAKSFVLDLLRETLATKTPSSERALSDSRLLEDINRGFPIELWDRYRELVAKREMEALSATEQEELISLIDRIEMANAHRLACLSELATRRRVPLKTLMAEMGIRPAANV
jgi:hypothetical protein